MKLTRCIGCWLQLAQCQDRMMELEKMIQNPHDEERVRFLEGKDPSPTELQSKLEEVSSMTTLIVMWNSLCSW